MTAITIKAYRTARNKPTRYYAVYDGAELLAVTVYRKGAECIAARLGAMPQARPAPVVADVPVYIWQDAPNCETRAIVDHREYSIRLFAPASA
jgi:hypothetical protein